ncbi:hypothetical protein CAEBREN_18773 [Caenorhabditis brenneri]|uniref:Uncharacterized protein n=1 Tax=Caenorhabditis brenneri TaxID=135651 RepID=G0P3E4_CAEBE|nr:hypothetical protein CAEBREN_18773 [Caenorhabditis brenneri]
MESHILRSFVWTGMKLIRKTLFVLERFFPHRKPSRKAGCRFIIEMSGFAIASTALSGLWRLSDHAFSETQRTKTSGHIPFRTLMNFSIFTKTALMDFPSKKPSNHCCLCC